MTGARRVVLPAGLMTLPGPVAAAEAVTASAMSLRDIVCTELTKGLAARGVAFTFPSIEKVTNTKDSLIEMMAACRERIGEGSSIMMFPEGTRSTTGQMRPFKAGAFELAREAGIPVVPIVLRGTRNALPKRGFVLQGRHAISVTVLPAVPAEEGSALTSSDLTTHVQQLIADELARTPQPEVSS